MIPAISGAETLVPASVTQPPKVGLKTGMFVATAEMSEIVRPGQCASCCQAGLAIQAEQPLPAAASDCCQTRSCQPRRPCARASMVPPTEVTVGRSAGNPASVKPESPLEATTVRPRGW